MFGDRKNIHYNEQNYFQSFESILLYEMESVDTDESTETKSHTRILKYGTLIFIVKINQP